MPVETAADLASMFEEDEFAEAAAYLAPALGATPVACVVIIDRGQGRESFSAAGEQTVGSERRLWVRRTAPGAGGLSDVQRGGAFTLELDGEVLIVAGLPKLDQAGALWSVELVSGG